MGSCNGCGSCCNPVILWDENVAGLQLAADAVDKGEEEDQFGNIAWFKQLVEIDEDEARRRRPNMLPLEFLSQTGENPHFFECSHFDPETRGCKVHDTDELPQVCDGYPWYPHQYGPDADVPYQESHEALDVECSYVEDTPVFIQFIEIGGDKCQTTSS